MSLTILSSDKTATTDPPINGTPAPARPVELKPALSWRAMANVGISMLFHDRLKLLGTLLGVIFAVVLSNQQGAIFFGLLSRNLLLQRNSGADVWITPAATEWTAPGELIPDSTVYQAKAMRDVEWASPILVGAGNLKLPSGGTEAVQIIGVEMPDAHGGPWNVVAGRVQDLAQPDAFFFEDSDREKFGGLNLGSVRELNEHQVQAVGFTWGLIPFGPSYAFTSFDTAREINHVDNHRVSFVLVKVRPGADPAAVAAELQRRLPNQKVMTQAQFEATTRSYLLTRTPLGMTFGTGAAFAFLVGFVIVALTMFSSVVDHIRQFGTLKAIGARTRDLAKLLAVQALAIALIGSIIGEGLVGLVLRRMRSPEMGLLLPSWMLLATIGGMILLCLFASSLALLRLRRLEPGIVFRE
jgi:putative ABC transport system permease protein